MAHRPLLDINICLDLLLKRNPHLHTAAQIFQASEQGKIQVVVSAISFDTMFYIMRATHSVQETVDKLKRLSSITYIGSADDQVIKNSLVAGWNDLEDAIQYYSAVFSECDAVITRNLKDYSPDSIPVLSPIEYISAHL